MKQNRFDYPLNPDIAWCPGCGNYPLLTEIKQALEELDLNPRQVVISSGIGQAAKMPQYIDTNFFNGLHGRALAVAVAIKMANPSLVVIAEGGDGDMYGEGGNHFIHNIRRNVDVTHLVHNNMVYGLTLGQASPTSRIGFKTSLQVEGVTNEPINPLSVAIALGAPFVARTYVGHAELTVEIVKQAIQYPGYALVDIFDPCVTFNKVNTYQWYKENSYILDDSHDSSDKMAAMAKAFEEMPFPLGVLYRQKEIKATYVDLSPAYARDTRPLYQRPRRSAEALSALME